MCDGQASEQVGIDGVLGRRYASSRAGRRASQYTAGDYQQVLTDWDIQVSMNGVGSWYDNAPMESFFGTLKQEWVYPRTFHSRQEVRTEIFYYIEAFYNQRLLHSALDYCSPVEYEQRYYQELLFA
jgi:transposase InsO family protein